MGGLSASAISPCMENAAKMNDRNQTVLGLLAIMVGAVVGWGATSGPFGPWDIMIGIVVTLVAIAFSHEFNGNNKENIAFCAIYAFGPLYIIGPFIDIFSGYMDLFESLISFEHKRKNGANEWSQKYSFISIRDLVFLLIWSIIAMFIFWKKK